ncbi:MAG: hypothetical protein IJZ56_02110 [Oscillospiraceae bacterium]|nr:hypothetical protein [Oscillospiraceae bacterium]
MRKLIIIALVLSLVLIGCTAPNSDRNTVNAPDLHLSETFEDQSSQTDPTESLKSPASGPMTSDPAPTTPTVLDPSKNSTDETNAPQQATETPTTPTLPIEETKPTTPPETVPTQPPETEPEETQPVTEPEETAPQIDQNSYEFKRQVAQYAAQYINQYRAAAGVGPCEVLPGMTLVAEYRADQLTRNYAHDTADKREALAYYQYGRWIDATIVGLAPEASYYEADAAEAICAGFEGKTAEEMGKYIADLCRNSPSHWSYIGSSKFSYIGIGVEYRAGSAYRWYGCVMVGRTNYG